MTTTYTVRRTWQTKDTLTTVVAATPDDAYAAYVAGEEHDPLDQTDVVIEPEPQDINDEPVGR